MFDWAVGFRHVPGMMIRRSQLVDRSRVQYFHVVSRVVDRRLRLGDAERNFFVRLIKRQEGFSGVEVMGYCVMGNHFHLLLRVPLRPAVIAEAEIWRRVRHIYSRARVEEFEAMVREWRESGDDLRVREFFDRLRARMYDLSSFVREVKLRFSKWYNRQNDRTGTLWEERFRSVVIEGREGALMTVLAYLDLNPVRAGIVVEPGGYRWSQYGEAMAGGRRARRRMAEIVSGCGPMISWEQACAHYSELLMERGGNSEESPAVRDGDKVQRNRRENAAPGKLMEK
jgi:REP element-mobilizing transposase RayT